nr:hypothetical protein [Bdellovibrionales bacterium]
MKKYLLAALLFVFGLGVHAQDMEGSEEGGEAVHQEVKKAEPAKKDHMKQKKKNKTAKKKMKKAHKKGKKSS